MSIKKKPNTRRNKAKNPKKFFFKNDFIHSIK